MTRALVVRLDSIGDVLLCGPAVRAVAASAAVEELWMLCGPAGAAAARLLPGVDRVLEWACPWIVRDAPPLTELHLDRLVDRLRSARIDVAVILTSFHQSALPTALALRLADVPFIVGISTDYPGSLLDVRLVPGVDLREDQPEPLRALAVAAAAGFALPEEDDGLLGVVPPPAAPAPIGARSGYVVVHPGATAASRRWSPERYAATVDGLHAAGYGVVVTGSATERALAESVSDRGRRALDLSGRLTLPELAAVLAQAAVVVCGNTGPAHLAAAVGTPVVSLFSPVVPAVRWAPYGVPHVLLGDQTAPCRNTRAVDCPVPGHPCLEHVHPEEVLTACDILVGGERRAAS